MISEYDTLFWGEYGTSQTFTVVDPFRGPKLEPSRVHLCVSTAHMNGGFAANTVGKWQESYNHRIRVVPAGVDLSPLAEHHAGRYDDPDEWLTLVDVLADETRRLWMLEQWDETKRRKAAGLLAQARSGLPSDIPDDVAVWMRTFVAGPSCVVCGQQFASCCGGVRPSQLIPSVCPKPTCVLSAWANRPDGLAEHDQSIERWAR